MRLFVKFFFILFLLILGLNCYAELPDTTEFNTIKEYKEYFDDYTKRLYENFQPGKRFFFKQGEFVYFFINNDGSIEHLDTFISNNRFSRYCKKVVHNTTAYPFPEQIKDDKIFIFASIHYWSQNTYKTDLYGRTKSIHSICWKPYYDKPSINVVDISIEKENKKFTKNK